MATKRAGGKITGLLALGFESALALDLGDPVMVVGPYEVALCNGSKPCVGVVSVRNVKRGVNGEFPVDNPGGDVTVEMRGFYVRTVLSGAAITAGTEVGYGAAGTLVPAGAGVSTVGVALMAATAAGQSIDVVFR